MMGSAQRARISLLDGRKLDIVIQPKLATSELANIIASYCGLNDPDKHYFGIAFYDESLQQHWLQSERCVLDHELKNVKRNSNGTIDFYHLVRLYVKSHTALRHATCVQYFFLQFLKDISKPEFCVESAKDLLHLHTCALQACFGNFTDEDAVLRALRSLDLSYECHLSRSCTSADNSEFAIIEAYKKLIGLSRGEALLQFIATYESSMHYGMHFFQVRDKNGAPWILGLSNRGIFQFDPANMAAPKLMFAWRQLENVYFRDKKFSIEVKDSRKVMTCAVSSSNLYENVSKNGLNAQDELSQAMADPSTQMSVSRRAFGPNSLRILAYFCSTPEACKTLWTQAVALHEFRVDKNFDKVLLPNRDKVTEELNEICEKNGGFFLANLQQQQQHSWDCSGDSGCRMSSDLGSSVSTQSLQSIQSLGIEGPMNEEERNKTLEVYRKLQNKKEHIEDMLMQKLKELRDVCIKEGADLVAKLEVAIEIQRKITAAAGKLAQDKSTSKGVRRKRKQDHQKSLQKLKKLEQQLHQTRLSASKPDLSTMASYMLSAQQPSTGGKVKRGVLASSGSRSGKGLSSFQKGFAFPKSAPSSPTGSLENLNINLESNRVDLQPPFVMRQRQLPFHDQNAALDSRDWQLGYGDQPDSKMPFRVISGSGFDSPGRMSLGSSSNGSAASALFLSNTGCFSPISEGTPRSNAASNDSPSFVTPPSSRTGNTSRSASQISLQQPVSHPSSRSSGSDERVPPLHPPVGMYNLSNYYSSPGKSTTPPANYGSLDRRTLRNMREVRQRQAELLCGKTGNGHNRPVVNGNGMIFDASRAPSGSSPATSPSPGHGGVGSSNLHRVQSQRVIRNSPGAMSPPLPTCVGAARPTVQSPPPAFFGGLQPGTPTGSSTTHGPRAALTSPYAVTGPGFVANGGSGRYGTPVTPVKMTSGSHSPQKPYANTTIGSHQHAQSNIVGHYRSGTYYGSSSSPNFSGNYGPTNQGVCHPRSPIKPATIV